LRNTEILLIEFLEAQFFGNLSKTVSAVINSETRYNSSASSASPAPRGSLFYHNNKKLKDYVYFNFQFNKWIKSCKIDILALQELRALSVSKPLELINYYSVFNTSKFHGTAIFSKVKPLKVTKTLGYRRFDSEGRFIELEFEDFIFINVYMPHGKRDKSELSYKLDSYSSLIKHLSKLLKSKKPIILVGDFNIAYKESDLARPKENKNNIMFTKEEREQIEKIIHLGFVDSFRKFHSTGGFTWWPRAYNLKERDIGWRIDYIFVSKELESYLKNAFVPNLQLLDHCPVICELQISQRDFQK